MFNKPKNCQSPSTPLPCIVIWSNFRLWNNIMLYLKQTMQSDVNGVNTKSIVNASTNKHCIFNSYNMLQQTTVHSVTNNRLAIRKTHNEQR